MIEHRSCLSAVLSLFALLAGAPLLAATTQPTSPPVYQFRCANNAPASAQPVMVPQSGLQALSGLRYECYTSADGNALLTAQAGVQHEQTVLLIHGLGTSGHHDWRETLPVLAQRYHVLAIDLPGFGGSPSLPQGYQFDALARLLRQVLQHYAVGPAIVIGHSLGGAIALDFAHRHPQLLERLILVDVAGVLQKQVFANHIAQWPLPQQIGLPPLDRVLGQLGRHIDLVKRNVLNWPEQFFDLTGFLRDNPGLRSLILRDQVMVDAAIGLVEADFSAAIRQTQTATFILWGSDDTITPVRTGRLLAHRMPNARLYLVPGARHVPMLEAPGEFHRLLGDALQMPSKLGTPALKAVLPASLEQAPELQCTQQNGGRYSGAIQRLILDNCHGVRIEDASIGELVLRHSSAEMSNVEISSNATAVTAMQSMLIGTAITLKGQLAVVSDGSRFDLAGATLVGKDAVAEIVSDSIFYLSVSEWQRGDHRQDRHEVLHLPAGRY